MGVEFRLEVPSDVEAVQLKSMLVDLGGTVCASLGNMLEFRSQGNATGMPDAFPTTIEGGIHFCDNGGFGRAILGRSVAVLNSKFRNVSVHEL
jgi:hypothetical protein